MADKVNASQARKLGTLLIDGAMQIRHGAGFSTYDRLFPNQDIMPIGGFGNIQKTSQRKKIFSPKDCRAFPRKLVVRRFEAIDEISFRSLIELAGIYTLTDKLSDF